MFTGRAAAPAGSPCVLTSWSPTGWRESLAPAGFLLLVTGSDGPLGSEADDWGFGLENDFP